MQTPPTSATSACTSSNASGATSGSIAARSRPSPEARGRWLGEIYAESDARLNYRKDVLDFLQLLAREDQQFVAAIDRMLKYLWRKNAEGEDIAYLLGRFIHAQPIKDELLRGRTTSSPSSGRSSAISFAPRSSQPKPYRAGRGDAGADDDARGATGALGISSSGT